MPTVTRLIHQAIEICMRATRFITRTPARRTVARVLALVLVCQGCAQPGGPRGAALPPMTLEGATAQESLVSLTATGQPGAAQKVVHDFSGAAVRDAQRKTARTSPAPAPIRYPSLMEGRPRLAAAPTSGRPPAGRQDSPIQLTAGPPPRRKSELDIRLAQGLEEAADADVLPPQPLPPAPAPEGVDPQDVVHIPLDGGDSSDQIDLRMANGRLSLVARDAPLHSILNLLAQQQGLNLIVAEDVSANISVTLADVEFEEALGAIVGIAGCTWTQQRNIVMVTRVGGDSQMNAEVQGRIVQVFPLNFVSAVDIEVAVKGLLSPAGQIFTSQSSPTDRRRTQELLVVEDIPTSVARVSELVRQIDQPPRQVLIEAHILQVDLRDDTRNGVNWNYIMRIAGSDAVLSTVGFANPAAVPGSVFSLSGDKLNLVIEALKSTSDAKTLAAPKVIVANGQEARVQIGEKLGFFVTTTTETSTLQNVNFLNTGVVLRVTPQISNDCRVLMTVRPEVSAGRISPLGLPESTTTEAETTILMDDGAGMVIGGLIKEENSDNQDKVPLLGDLWLVGRLFQGRTVARRRSEIIIALIPRIAPYTPDVAVRDQIDVDRAQTPLFENGLNPILRPLDPRLPDAINNPRRLRVNRLGQLISNPLTTNPKPPQFYFPTPDEEALPPEIPIID